MIGEKVTLTQEEIRICREIAERRNDSCKKIGKTDLKFSHFDSEELDFIGFSGEFAFCKMFNLMPDFYIGKNPASKRLDKGDCVLHGLIIDVKTTIHKFGQLKCPKWQIDPEIHLYALMIMYPDHSYEFRGFFPADKVFVPSRLGSCQYPDRYIVDQYELLEFEEVISIEQKETLTQGCKGKTSACVQSELRPEAKTCGRCIAKQSQSEQADSDHLGKLS